MGYAVAAFEIENAPESTEEEAASEIVREEDREIGGAPGGSPAWPPRPGDDPIVALARASVESIVAHGHRLPPSRRRTPKSSPAGAPAPS